MPTKTLDPKSGKCVVEFRLPADVGAREAWLCGEFNDWSRDSTPMAPQEDGSLAVTIDLEPGQSYRFRYYLGAEHWENDWAADAYVDNEFGGSDSLVIVPNADPAPAARPARKRAAKDAAPKKAAAKKAAAKKAAPKKSG
jgi:1,4-alpha-glucan branching enzyme